MIRRGALALLCSLAATMGQEVGSKVCAGCHAEIYRKYSATSMAQSSGKAGGTGFREIQTDAALGVDYRVSPAP